MCSIYDTYTISFFINSIYELKLIALEVFLRCARGVLKVALNEKQENTTLGLIWHPEFLVSEIKDLNRNQKIYFKVMLRKKQGIRSF